MNTHGGVVATVGGVVGINNPLTNNSPRIIVVKSPTNDSALEKLKDKDEKVEDVERHAGNDLSHAELYL